MQYYLDESTKVLESLSASEKGLSSEEAQSRLAQKGKNKLVEGKKDSLFKRFLNQLADPMILILLAAAALSGITAAFEGESFADVFIILFVVIINAVLGVYQESKAEKAIEALKEMSAASSKTLRDGEIRQIKSEDLVPGDVVLLEAGDAVPADARILESASLKIEEAALTGESVPVEKISQALPVPETGDVPLGDRRNMAYMGSTVVYGRGKAVITDTGMGTEMGKIASAISEAKDEKTPLQQRLSELSKIMSFIVLGICAFMFVFSLLRAGSFSVPVVLDTFMIAVSLAVAAIPEGLAAVVTIQLSIGVTKMAEHHAVIRKLTAVETLGCTQVICSDKTGTLTQNRMTVVEHAAEDEKLLAQALALCSDAELGTDGKAVGEPTEAALVQYAATLSLPKPELKEKYPRIGEAPFDSNRKMMSTVHRETDGTIIQYTKGAPDEVLKRCTHYLSNGKEHLLNEQERSRILAQNKHFADQALRVLGAAMRHHEAAPDSFSPDFLEQGLCFIGLVGMIDPVRPEVIPAIQECQGAGIRPVMITGDHRDTAAAIAAQLGILTDPSQAITGSQLDGISDEELSQTIGNYSVYARVQPEHKVRIVKAWKKAGRIVAMTGDGVNDAPSIKSADIGVGMGITGTDVTKNVADMVLADDNFATIVTAVEEGRRIYDNIRKAIQFLLSSNISEIIAIFTATVLGFTILNPVHILWINLITDTFPALALGMEKADKDLMKRPPRPAKEGIFAGGLGLDVVYQGLLVAVITLAAYFVGHYMESGLWEIQNSPDGMTMAFLTMSMAEIFHSFNTRSRRGSVFAIGHHNLLLFGAMLFSLLLTTAVIYIPFLSELFAFEHISLMEYLVSLGLAVSVIPIVELVKAIQRACQRDKMKR